MVLSESGMVLGFIFISQGKKIRFPKTVETNFPSESTSFFIFLFCSLNLSPFDLTTARDVAY
jgi:hypothetical protein